MRIYKIDVASKDELNGMLKSGVEVRAKSLIDFPPFEVPRGVTTNNVTQGIRLESRDGNVFGAWVGGGEILGPLSDV